MGQRCPIPVSPGCQNRTIDTALDHAALIADQLNLLMRGTAQESVYRTSGRIRETLRAKFASKVDQSTSERTGQDQDDSRQ